MGGSRPTTWGLFSSNGKLLSSIAVQLIHQVLFVTSKSGRSSSWTLRVGLEAGARGAPWPGHCCWLCFWTCFFFFCCSGYIFVRPEHKEPLWFGAGSWAASKLSRLASTYWHFPLRSRTFCSTVELWERSERDFTLQPNHMVSSGERGGLDVREEGLEG